MASNAEKEWEKSLPASKAKVAKKNSPHFVIKPRSFSIDFGGNLSRLARVNISNFSCIDFHYT